MRTIRHSLAWKEWHEHKWKLAAATAVLLVTTAIVMIVSEKDRFQVVGGFLLVGTVPMAVFVGLGAAANERSRGTLQFLQALPVKLGHVALMKCVMGLATVLVAIILTVLSIYLWRIAFDVLGVHYQDALDELRVAKRGQGPFTWGSWHLAITVSYIGIAASLFIWAAAWGVNRADEISAGAVALTVMVGWWVLLAAGWSVLLMGSTGVETARLRAVGVGSAPLGFLVVHSIAERDALWSISLGLLSAAIVHGLLVAKYVWQFGRAGDSVIRSPRAAMVDLIRSEWLAPPRRWPLTATAWKQLRESGPIVLAGLAGIVGIVAMLSISQRVRGQGTIIPSPLGTMYFQVAIVFGFMIALVVGIGVALNDLGPRLNTFWRSRPIHPSAWFWCKYITGLAIVLAAIYVPIVLVAALTDPSTFTSATNANILALPAAHLAIFAAAVATTCLVRHAVYAAILSIGLLYLGLVAVWLAIAGARLLGWLETPSDGLDHLSDGQVAIGMLFNFVVCTLLAWLAMRYDWGRKSRY